MDLKELENILSLLKQNDVSEFELNEEGKQLKLKRGTPVQVLEGLPQYEHSELRPAIVSMANGQHPQAHMSAGLEAAIEPKNDYVKLESPIVGTFYRKPAPDSDPFVKEGDVVKKGSTLCIVEAMKLMNEIDAPCDGKIEKILPSDGHVVEFGEVLFLINPDV